MHCKNWKTILPLAITFLVGVCLTELIENKHLRNNTEVVKITALKVKKKNEGKGIAGDNAHTYEDICITCDGMALRSCNKEEDIPTKNIKKSLRIVSKPKAIYTDLAKTNQIQGKVTLRVTFLANEKIGSIAVIESLPDGLTEKAIESARKIKFKPAMDINKTPFSVTRQVHYTFTLY